MFSFIKNQFLPCWGYYFSPIENTWSLRWGDYSGLYRCVQILSHDRLFVTSWTVARQAPLPMEFARQEYWSGWPFPSPGDLPDPGIEAESLTLQADSLPSPPGNNPILVPTT